MNLQHVPYLQSRSVVEAILTTFVAQTNVLIHPMRAAALKKLDTFITYYIADIIVN